MRFNTKHTLRYLVFAAVGSLGTLAVQSRDVKTSTEQKTGIASWYGPRFHGRKTANGEIFDQKKLTCASNQFPLGTWLRVTNLRTNKSVIVKVNDRMSRRVNRVVDLSKAAGDLIGIDKTGISKVSVVNLGKKFTAS
ncbi:MAG: septal ring lytic transglycosylase RlpA family protein [Bacteroidetes bacterium]|nr:MAG: septal ring lytic transglycosylase RlpA family protein [Bacteroidota bacterium]